jgi:hypothetical protein
MRLALPDSLSPFVFPNGERVGVRGGREYPAASGQALSMTPR